MNDLKRALVIDDDDDIRELLQVLLESAGFTVDAVSDGIEATRLTKDYAVIILDMKMPVFDGADLTAYWSLTDPKILDRVIILTGYSGLTRGHQLATFAAVAKPFDYEELLRVVNECASQAQPQNDGSAGDHYSAADG